MSEVSWIKVQTDIFENRKIRQIMTMPDGDSIVLIWIRLLTLAGETNDGGAIYLTKRMMYTPDTLSAVFGKSAELVADALCIFVDYDMIEIDEDGMIFIMNWEKYQNAEKLEEIRSQTRARVAKHREKKKAEAQNACNAEKVLPECYSNECNAIEEEEDKDKEEDIDIESPTETEGARTHARETTIPSKREIQAYIKERGYDVDADRFMTYYSQKGWRAKNGDLILDRWKTVLDSWAKNEIDDKPPERPPRRPPRNAKVENSSFDVEDYFKAALKRSYAGASDEQIDQLMKAANGGSA